MSLVFCDMWPSVSFVLNIWFQRNVSFLSSFLLCYFITSFIFLTTVVLSQTETLLSINCLSVCLSVCLSWECHIDTADNIRRTSGSAVCDSTGSKAKNRILPWLSWTDVLITVFHKCYRLLPLIILLYWMIEFD